MPGAHPSLAASRASRTRPTAIPSGSWGRRRHMGMRPGGTQTPARHPVGPRLGYPPRSASRIGGAGRAMKRESTPENSDVMTGPRQFSEIDWSNWSPTHYSTLTFVLREAEVLLIRKKRGLGAGKINGPGGKLEGNETAERCAVREVQEELGITPRGLEGRGELRFQFVDGYSIHVYVFVADSHSGQPCETEEAIPLWFPIKAIPYDQMWADDRLWLEHALEGRSVRGDFLFDGDTMVDYRFEHS